MKKTYNIFFLAKSKEWYPNLFEMLHNKFNAIHIPVKYIFEKKHPSKFDVIIDSLFLFFTFPITYITNGKGLYILTTRHLPILFWMKIFSYTPFSSQTLAINFYFHGLREKFIIKIVLGFLLRNSDLTIIAPSLNDLDYFKSLAPKTQMHYILFGLDTSWNDGYEVKNDGYIFCGGFNNRDFNIIFDVAREIDRQFVVITSSREIFSSSPPDNVRLLHDVDLKKFQELLAAAALVIIPLKDDIGASGQIVTLSAMGFAKPIVYTNFNVVSEYFIDKVNGLSFEAGNRLDLKEKITKILDDQNLQITLGKNAQDYFQKNFTTHATNQKIADIVDLISSSKDV